MLSLAKIILIEYKSVIIQMFKEQVVHGSTKANLELMCDSEVFLGLTYIIFMLECVHGLSKFTQTHETFIYDFVVTMKTYQGELYQMYCNGQKKYGFEIFMSLFKHYERCNDVLHHGRVKACSLRLLNPQLGLNMLF